MVMVVMKIEFRLLLLLLIEKYGAKFASSQIFYQSVVAPIVYRLNFGKFNFFEAK